MAQRRYGLSVLNYIVTSNHVHLLVADQGNDEIPPAMQLIAGRTAQEFNDRRNRHGAFWEDRYHTTAVQTDDHLLQCMTYIDLNMVRAGAVENPSEWDVSGYSEIQRPWKRKGVIDYLALFQLFNVQTERQLAAQRNKAVYSELTYSQRQPAWTESVGVGDEAFLSNLKSAIGANGLHRRIRTCGNFMQLRENGAAYFQYLGPKRRN